MSTSSHKLSREKLRTLRSLATPRIRKRKGMCVVEGDRALQEAGSSGNLAYLVLSEREATELNIRDVKA